MTNKASDTPVEFKPKEAGRELWDRFHRYRLERHHDVRPEDPPTPNDIVEKNMKRDDPFGQSKYYIVESDTDVIGSLSLGAATPAAPGYESNKQYVWGYFDVATSKRRAGIGTKELARTLEVMREWDRTVLTMWVEESDGHAFLKRVGAVEKSQLAENRLDFRKIDWDLMNSWVEDGKNQTSDLKIKMYEDRLPDEILDEYTPVLSELLMTMPFDDLDHGEIVITPETARESQRRWDDIGTQVHTLIAWGPDGKLAGMTDVSWNPSKPNYINQRFTGVHPRTRGKGLGKLLKASMLEFLRTKYEDVHWIVTGNANSNDPMLAINRAMGYQQYQPASLYQLTADDMSAFLRGGSS